MSPPSATARGFQYDAGTSYDEAFESRGAPRAQYRLLLDAVAATGAAELAERVDAAVARTGATFGQSATGRPFPVDPIPRLIARDEWEWLAGALAQRGRALNLFIADVYSERRIVSAGAVPADAVASTDHYEPAMAGVEVPAGHAPVIGFDLVRGDDGQLRVLEDNLRTPSGLAFASAVRAAVEPLFRHTGLSRLPFDHGFSQLAEVLRRAAPATDDPVIALLSDGPGNSAWWEHRTLARRLCVSLVVPEHLRLHQGRLCQRLPSGKLRPIDVVYRRTDEDRLRDDDGRATWLGEMLLEPLRSGRLAVVNAPGSGVADDKLIHAYVEEMVRFYLNEEPLIESVRTYDLTQRDLMTRALGRLSAMVIKPRTGQGGEGVFIGARSSRDERSRIAQAVGAAPHRFVAQETVRLSSHPTVTGDRLEPRHIDLRVFSVGSADRTVVLPAPLTRVALGRGELIVNSSRGGGAKDTWIV